MAEKRTMYNQSAFYKQMQVYKRESVNMFWKDYVNYTAKALCAGTVFAILMSGPASLVANPIKSVLKHPVLPVWAGVAGGFALSSCADRFNRLHQIENKIASGQGNSSEIGDRLETLKVGIYKQSRQQMTIQDYAQHYQNLALTYYAPLFGQQSQPSADQDSSK